MTDTKDELESARAEIRELRQAVVAMCDTYSANRSEKLKVKAYRSVAAKAPGAFTTAAVEAELAQLERRDRDAITENEQLRASCAKWQEIFTGFPHDAQQALRDMRERVKALEAELAASRAR